MKILTNLTVGKISDTPNILRAHCGYAQEIKPGFFRSIVAGPMGVVLSTGRGDSVVIPLAEIERIAIAAEPRLDPGPGNPAPLKPL